jgi:glycosyltransferase involved in cell wall biosynthesis
MPQQIEMSRVSAGQGSRSAGGTLSTFVSFFARTPCPATPECPAQVAAVVCAYNEEKQIRAVLSVLTTYPGFSEVIVVDDGSSDQTYKVAATFPIRLVRHEFNLGKGAAMMSAVIASSATVIFFCDADISGLNHKTISEVLGPVLAGHKDMKIAQRASSWYSISFILAMTPKLGGVRAVTRRLWETVPTRFKRRFMIEAALNHFAQRHGCGFEYAVVEELSQIIKEKKYGWAKGFVARIKMCADVVSAYTLLNLLEVNRLRAA